MDKKGLIHVITQEGTEVEMREPVIPFKFQFSAYLTSMLIACVLFPQLLKGAKFQAQCLSRL